MNTRRNKERGAELHDNRTEFIAATSGDMEGEIELIWEPVKGANTYIIQKCYENSRNTKWEQVDIVDRSSCTISKLKSGKKYKFRVAAVKAKRQGPWSDIITKKAP
jgi:hypothetical protein